MTDKFVLLLFLLICVAAEVTIMIGMIGFVIKGQSIFAIITMLGVHYYASKTTEIFKKLIQDKYEDERND